MITIKHNFDESKFKWLWAKYVKAGNLEKHCTACLKGPYSKKFSGTSNKNMLEQPILVMDEVAIEDYKAIYFCGVLKKGYPKTNYPHNVHFAVVPEEGATDVWDFENWHVEITGGKLSPIPSVEMLDERFFTSPYDDHYYTCRIFRWMVGFFYPELVKNDNSNPTSTEIKKESIRKSLEDAGYSRAESVYESYFEITEETDESIEDIDLEIYLANGMPRPDYMRDWDWPDNLNQIFCDDYVQVDFDESIFGLVSEEEKVNIIDSFFDYDEAWDIVTAGAERFILDKYGREYLIQKS